MFAQLGRSLLLVEQLEDRLTPATTATFAFGVLAVVGDAAANHIVVQAVDSNLQVTDNGQPSPFDPFEELQRSTGLCWSSSAVKAATIC